MRTLIFALVVASAVGPLSAASAAASLSEPAENGRCHVFSSEQKARFTLVDHLKLPEFWWPRTLLSYPVRFEAPAQADQLQLRELGRNVEVPFQLSEIKKEGGRLKFAVVNFFADLPSGGARQFELSVGKPAVCPAGVRQATEGNTVVLDAGKMKVRLPASRAVAPGQKVPGPILQLNRGAGWLGDSTLVSPRVAVKSVRTETLESGPLFVACRVTYQFEGGASYSATLRAIADYDFIECFEEMKGLKKEAGVYVENAWSDFHPTHRFILGSPFGGTRRIDVPMVQAFRGEDPAFTGPTRFEELAVEMLPSLTPYWPNGWGGNREAAFWDERSGEALGLFIRDVSKWQDHEYAIWTSADTLKVKYRYDKGVLFWKWPLVTGTRFTGVTSYRHGATLPQAPLADQTGGSWNDEVDSIARQKELPLDLRIHYADIGLDRVKDWLLAYPDSAKVPTVPLKPGRQKSLDAYMKALPTCAMTAVAKGMFHPVALRDMGAWVVPDFHRFRASLTPAQREQATAMLLFAAYVAAEDEYSPMQTMLGGHPNFMGDLKYPMAAASFLFPEHPMAQQWRDQYEKFMELCGHFYVRPAVPQWEARAGRFTESIATYNWAFMDPTSDANRMGLESGAHNFYATPELANMGDYLVGILTGPVTLDATKDSWPDGTPLTWENGFKRIHPPQGAHSGKRGAGGAMYLIGEQLRHYRPLTAEHMMWGAFPSAGQGFEDRAGLKPEGEVNRGTNPHLTSAKYTGYGVVLRAGVDTPEEIAVFLQQIDKGPNYRWGYANQNGSGDIYYYAKGKSYSGHGFEDTGDRHADDALYSCNTGVYKNYHFSCIGMNELTRPFYNLDVAQFAEIVPETGPGAYSWPEYQSRSVMLVGTEYIITYDAILEPCGTRFAWNSAGVHDELPFIHPLKGGAENIMDTSSRARDKQKGVLYDVWKGGGDRMMLVTHLAGVKVLPARRVRGETPVPFSRIQTPTSEDVLFQNSTEISWKTNGITFCGTAGVIRHRKNHQTELALFHGKEIGNGEVCLLVDDPELGVSVAYTTPAELSGTCFGRQGGTLTLKAPGPGKFYLDGALLAATAAGAFKLPPGQHRWEFTSRLPEPMPPVMLRTENRSGGAKVFFTTTPGAEKYRVELSRDNAASWERVGETVDGKYELAGMPNGTKVHVRAVAFNAQRESRPAGEYPLYVTDQAPLPPEGLKLEVGLKQVKLTWGEVLGATEYRLYRRAKGETQFKEICRGLRHSYTDSGVKTVPAFAEPGLANNFLRDASGYTVYEYAVAAVNGNGQGTKCLPVDTDPTSWRNWNPTADLRFKRQTGFWLPPFVEAKDVPPAHYLQ